MNKFFLIFALNFACYFFLNSREPLTVTSEYLKKPGEISNIIEYIYYETDHFWNTSGTKKKAYNRLRQNQIELYTEVGLTCSDTMGIEANYVLNDEKLNGSKQGFGDMELYWKHYLSRVGHHFFSSRVVGIIPVGKKKTTVRYGEWGVELDLHCLREFCLWEKYGWYELLGGYRYYHGFPADQIKFNALLGYQLFSHLRIITALYLNYGINNHQRSQFYGPILTLPPRYRLLKAEAHGVIHVAKYVSAFIGGFQHLWGENIGTGGGITSGFWVDF